MPSPAIHTTTAGDDTVKPDSACGSLYVVATPIGNLSDLSQRARDSLIQAAWIAVEDTRVSRTLLDQIGCRAPLVALHEHNEYQASDGLIARLQAGESGALISDAGTPGISDPGAILVARAQAQGLRVVPIPGASAPITLLSAAGLPAGPFHFEGFLPTRRKARLQRLTLLRDSTVHTGAHLVLFEAPHRIDESMSDALEVFGADREIVIGRELTKRFEEVHRCPLGSVAGWLAEHAHRTRGEFVLAIAASVRVHETNLNDGGLTIADTEAAPVSAEQKTAMLRHELDSRSILQALLDEMPLSQAVKLAERLTGLRHRELYQLALALRNGSLSH